VATVAFGVLLAVQLQAVESPSRTLETQSVDELTTLIGALTQETDRMQEELTELSVRVMTARNAALSERTAMTEQEDSLQGLRLVTGAAEGVGAGISLSISDALSQLDPYDLFTLVNELRSAGAEAIVIEDRRVGLRSSFTATPSGIALDGIVLREPYHLHAVGPPDDLSSSLRMPGGVIPSLENRAGVAVGLVKREELPVPAFVDQPTFEHVTAIGD
jgi:uncharacterized protein YlxW (UPF0749 family)